MTLRRFILSIIFGAFAGTILGRLAPNSPYYITIVLALLIATVTFGYGFGGGDENDQ
jgi:hypothetical protein